MLYANFVYLDHECIRMEMLQMWFNI